MSAAHETAVRIERIALIRTVPRGGFGSFEIDHGHPQSAARGART